MRLARLELSLYGHFRGAALDFSAPGLHVVLGRNEAGKSTTLRAITGFLYGIPRGSPDLRGNQARDLRLGGTLESGRTSPPERASFVRRGGVKNTLFDAKDSQLDDAAMNRFVSGVTEDSFVHAYGLNHETLRAGAQAILEGKGDLGESLFDAVIGGGGHVQDLVKRLAAEADAIYAHRASKPMLNEALKAFEEARKKQNSLQMLPEAFLRQEQGVIEETGRRDAALEKKKSLEQRRARLQRASKRAPRERERAHLVEVRTGFGALANQLGRIESLQSRFVAYERDVDQLRAQQAEVERLGGALAEALRAAELAPSESLREHARSEERIKPLLKQRTLLTERIELADAEIARSERALTQVDAPIADDAVSPIDRDALAVAIDRARTLGAIEDRLATESARLERQRAALATRSRALFDGTLDACVALRPPSLASIQALSQRETELSSRLGRANESKSKSEREIARLEKDEASRSGDFAPPDASALRASRDARDEAWRAVRAADAGKRSEAELALERLLREADVVADRMIAEADRVTALARLRAEISANRAELEKMRAECMQCQGEQANLAAEAKELFVSAGIPAIALAEMAVWVQRHAQLADDHARLTEEAAELQAEADRKNRVESDLRAAFAAPAGRLSELLAASTRRLEAIDERRRANVERERASAAQRENLADRTQRREKDAKQLAEVTAQVSAIVTPLGLGASATDDEVNRALARVRDVVALIEKKTDAEARTKTMAEGIRGFEDDLAAAGADLAPSLNGEPRTVARDLFELARQARATNDKLRSVDEILAELGDPGPLDDADRALAAEPESAESAIDDLTEQIDELERDGQSSLERLLGLKLGLDAMRKDSNAAEAAAVAQQHLARVREGAERYARIKLAQVILAREIERYREENQGPLLAESSKMFARLTLGAYSGIKAGFDDKDKPSLRCVRGDTEVATDALSDGTRDQLYLSLRLASLLKRAEVADPMPFVLDDVLIHFDDERASAALQVLAEISQKMQVLFFTHHARLVDLARAAVPADQLVVHTLGGESATAHVGGLAAVLR